MYKLELYRSGLAEKLGISDVMVDKPLCGEIVPSQHLREQMVKVLKIEPSRVYTISKRRDRKAKADVGKEKKDNGKGGPRQPSFGDEKGEPLISPKWAPAH